jgi:hypothetical protein
LEDAQKSTLTGMTTSLISEQPAPRTEVLPVVLPQVALAPVVLPAVPTPRRSFGQVLSGLLGRRRTAQEIVAVTAIATQLSRDAVYRDDEGGAGDDGGWG